MIIYINDKILNERNLYAYGPLNGVYGKKNGVDEDELMKVVTDNDYYLQRYYG